MLGGPAVVADAFLNGDALGGGVFGPSLGLLTTLRQARGEGRDTGCQPEGCRRITHTCHRSGCGCARRNRNCRNRNGRGRFRRSHDFIGRCQHPGGEGQSQGRARQAPIDQAVRIGPTGPRGHSGIRQEHHRRAHEGRRGAQRQERQGRQAHCGQVRRYVVTLGCKLKRRSLIHHRSVGLLARGAHCPSTGPSSSRRRRRRYRRARHRSG